LDYLEEPKNVKRIGLWIFLLGWAKAYGDLQVFHFLGLHALQVLSLLAWVFWKNNSKISGIVSLFILYLALQHFGWLFREKEFGHSKSVSSKASSKKHNFKLVFPYLFCFWMGGHWFLYVTLTGK
jgi:hypothetical protein